MRWLRLRVVLAVIVAVSFISLCMTLARLDDPATVVAAGNVLAFADRILGVWSIFPPAISWAFCGFLFGLMVYFGIWEAHRYNRPNLARVFIILPCAVIVLGAVTWPRLEMYVNVPMILRGTGGSARPGEVRNFAGLDFVWVPPGRFRMGSLPGEAGRGDDERARVVTLTYGFWISRYEVTQAQWEAVMEQNPSYFKECGGDCPVENITWADCQIFLRKLNALGEGHFRLPTEAEWEYACRAGATSAYAFGDDPGALDDYAWHNGNRGATPHPVGGKQPNAWGLYDMHGNVWEWCQDWYAPYPPGRATNPAGPLRGSLRPLRGGGWASSAEDCRAARRHLFIEGYFEPRFDLGLRPVRLAPGTEAEALVPAGGPEVPARLPDMQLLMNPLPNAAPPPAVPGR